MSDRNLSVFERYNQLCDKLNEYNYAYYNLNEPLVDDATYDALMKELQGIEAQYPEKKRKDSPSVKVGGEVSSSFGEVPHDPPMLSLANCSSETELNEFDVRCKKVVAADEPIEYSAELKYDGLAIEVIYENGKLILGSTRGNGIAGEDVTVNIRTIKQIPHLLDPAVAPGYLSLRGEVFMRHSEFERINRQRAAKEEQPFANPRNAASGSLRQLDATVTAERELDVVFYNLGRVSGEVVLENHARFVEYIKSLGLPCAHYSVIGSLNEVKDFYRYWIEHRHTLPFDIDGIVIKMNSFSYREQAGNTSKTPKWAIAWKFPAQEAITQLTSVDFQIGRSGVVTPVANLIPINIGGVMVKRATLHNFSEVKRLGIDIGDVVVVIRAGDVIPKVTAVKEKAPKNKSQKINQPATCPSCGSDLQQEEIYLRCVNNDCPAVKKEYLKFFVSKDAMDIEYFGPELVIRLMKIGKISTIADFFALTRDDLLLVDRMGEKLADKIIESINKRREIPLSFFLKSLGIRNVGEHVARVIARKAGSLDVLMKMEVEDLTAIHEIGPGVAESLYNYLRREEVRSLIADIQNAGVTILKEDIDESGSSLVKQKTFVLTGSLIRLGRKDAQQMIEQHGGRASSSVSSKTDYVVAGDNAGSKLTKARELGVAILNEDEFLKMFETE